jgi:hypothetical protein
MARPFDRLFTPQHKLGSASARPIRWCGSLETAGRPNPEPSCRRLKWQPTGPPSSQHNDLLPQHEDLGFQRRAWSEQIDDNPDNYSAEIQYSIQQNIIRFCVSRQQDGIYDRDRR